MVGKTEKEIYDVMLRDLYPGKLYTLNKFQQITFVFWNGFFTLKNNEQK
jgi:hypothetical protein